MKPALPDDDPALATEGDIEGGDVSPGTSDGADSQPGADSAPPSDGADTSEPPAAPADSTVGAEEPMLPVESVPDVSDSEADSDETAPPADSVPGEPGGEAEAEPPAETEPETPGEDPLPDDEAEAGIQAELETDPEMAPLAVEPGWVQDPATGRSAWQLADGSYQRGWFTHPATGDKYYLGADGLMVTGFFEADGARFYAGTDGVVQIGLLRVDGVRYMAGADGAITTGAYLEVNGKRRYAAADGAIVWKKGWFTRADGVRAYAYKNGELKKGWLTDKKKRYYLNADGVPTTGYFKVSGKKYYAKDNGVVSTKAGFVTRSDGVKILLRDKGVVKSAWFDYKNNRYRLDAEGVRAVGYFKVGGKKYYANKSGVVKKQGWFTNAEKKKAYARAGGVIKSGWVQVNGAHYHLDSEGVCKTGYFTVGKKLYYAKKDGAVVRSKGWFTRSDKIKAYACDGGAIKAGLVTVDGKLYYLDEEGVRRSGFFQAGGRHYYAKNGVIKKGWHTVKGERYYVGKKGYLLTGKQTIDGAGYTFDTDGRLLSVDATMLTVTRNGKRVTDTAANILARVVMAEVGGFRDAETYKAQAVAAHTYLRYQYSVGNTAPTVPDADPIKLVSDSVNAVAEEYLTYKGGPVLASYYAASNGKTNPSGDFWKVQHPYLVTVDSGYESKDTVTGFETTKTYTLEEFRARMDWAYPNGYTLDEDPAKWVQPTYNDAGYAKGTVKLGDRTPSVEVFYQTIFQLRSPAFTVKYSKKAGTITFTVQGYGHGVGMSQWGAYLYSKHAGWNYQKILAHYYPGTTLVRQ